VSETILIGREGRLERIPADSWRTEVRGARERMAERLQFMTLDHHRVRRLAVSALTKRSAALEPAWIASELKIELRRVKAILEDLERHLFFLICDRRGRVTWAYPVTSIPTPHRLTFSSGEQIFAA
jgi:hypothetical protein